jgi:hypothetical protein
VDGAPRSRLTVIAAIAAIVVTVIALVVGFVAAPSDEGGEPAEDGTAVDELGDVAGPSVATTTANTIHAEEHRVTVVDSTTVDASHLQHETAAPVERGEHVAHVEPVGHVEHSEPVDNVEHVEHVETPATDVHSGHELTPTTTTTTTTTTTAAPEPAELPAAAQDLLDRTAAVLAALPDAAAVEAAGYAPAGDAAAGFETYVADPYLDDDTELDADRIEAILVRDGVVVAATYVLNPGTALADAPPIAGEGTPWRAHDGRCREGERVVAVAGADGSCPRGQVLIGPPRLLVWLVAPACGPFSPLDCVV